MKKGKVSKYQTSVCQLFTFGEFITGRSLALFRKVAEFSSEISSNYFCAHISYFAKTSLSWISMHQISRISYFKGRVPPEFGVRFPILLGIPGPFKAQSLNSTINTTILYKKLLQKLYKKNLTSVKNVKLLK